MYASASNFSRARANDIGRITPNTGLSNQGRSNFPKHHWIPPYDEGSRPSSPYLLLSRMR